MRVPVLNAYDNGCGVDEKRQPLTRAGALEVGKQRDQRHLFLSLCQHSLQPFMTGSRSPDGGTGSSIYLPRHSLRDSPHVGLPIRQAEKAPTPLYQPFGGQRPQRDSLLLPEFHSSLVCPISQRTLLNCPCADGRIRTLTHLGFSGTLLCVSVCPSPYSTCGFVPTSPLSSASSVFPERQVIPGQARPIARQFGDILYDEARVLNQRLRPHHTSDTLAPMPSSEQPERCVEHQDHDCADDDFSQ